MVGKVRYRIAPPIRPGGRELVLGDSARDASRTQVLLGVLAEQGPKCPVWWSFDRESVVGIFGKRGSGKSYTLGVFLEGLGCASSHSPIGGNAGDRAVLLFDTLNVFQYSVVAVSQIPDSVLRQEALQDLESFGLQEQPVNVRVSFPAGTERGFYPDTYEPFALDTSLIGPDDYAHLFDINLYRDPMGQLLLASYERMRDHGGNNQTTSSAAWGGINDLAEVVANDPVLSETFAKETQRALLARLQPLLRMPLFSQEPTDLQHLLSAAEARVLLLGALTPPLRSVVAALLTRQIFNARARAAEASKFLKLRANEASAEWKAAKHIVETSPPRTTILIDEAQGYAPPSRANPCTDVLIQYVKEGRNHGLSLVFASQQPSAIHQEVLSQVDSIVAHRLTTTADIEAARRNAKGRRPEAIATGGSSLTTTDLLRSLGLGQAWVSHGDAPRSLALQVRPRLTAHGGIEG